MTLGTEPYQADVAVGPTGRVAAAFTRVSDRPRPDGGRYVELVARLGTTDGRLEPAVTLSQDVCCQPQTAVAPDGTAVVMWVESRESRVAGETVMAAWAPPESGFGPPQAVATYDDADGVYDLVAPAPGRVVATIAHGPKPEALVSFGSAFRQTPLLGIIGIGAPGRLAVDGRDGSILGTVGNETARISTLGASADTFATGGPTLSDPYSQIYGGPGGSAVTSMTSRRGRSVSLRVRTRALDGRLNPARHVARTPRDNYAILGEPALALPIDGRVVAAYGYDRKVHGRLVATLRVAQAAPGRRFGAPVTLARTTATLGAPSTAAVANTSYVAWAALDGPVRVATFEGSGTPNVVSLARSASDRDVALATGGDRVIATWEERSQLRMAALR